MNNIDTIYQIAKKFLNNTHITHKEQTQSFEIHLI